MDKVKGKQPLIEAEEELSFNGFCFLQSVILDKLTMIMTVPVIIKAAILTHWIKEEERGDERDQAQIAIEDEKEWCEGEKGTKREKENDWWKM